MGQITKAVNSVYKAGDVVTVTDTGQVYSTYAEMARFLNLSGFQNGLNRMQRGDEVTVIGSATHESQHYGEVIAVRTKTGAEMLIGYEGVSQPIRTKDENGQEVLSYDRVRLVKDNKSLLDAVAFAPDWALYVGQDDFGVFFFDHHPYELNSRSIVRGLLPATHKMQSHSWTDTISGTQALRIADVAEVPEVVIAGLRRELAEVKAELYTAKQKLSKIKGML